MVGVNSRGSELNDVLYGMVPQECGVGNGALLAVEESEELT